MKILTDWPQFTLQRVEEPSDVQSLRLIGTFDRLDGVRRESWDYLVQPRPYSLAATVIEIKENTREATYEVFANMVAEFDTKPGAVFAWVSSYWDPRLIWAILQGPSAWTQEQFEASSAYAWTDGTAWTKTFEVAKEHAGNRSDVTVVQGGWDHEHCDLCNKRVTSGDRFWKCEDDALRLFLCDSCYEVSAPTSDLALLFD